MMRASVLCAVGGYNPTLIAGEEPELCLRLRRRGWKIERIAHDMTWHDAAITRFGQWWRRAVRSGYGYAEGWALHGAAPERYCRREAARIWLYGAAIPVSALAGAFPTLGLSLGLFASYPLSAARVYRSTRRRGYSRANALENAAFTTLAKFAELQGTLKYHLGRRAGRRARIIEYKGV